MLDQHHEFQYSHEFVTLVQHVGQFSSRLMYAIQDWGMVRGVTPPRSGSRQVVVQWVGGANNNKRGGRRVQSSRDNRPKRIYAALYRNKLFVAAIYMNFISAYATALVLGSYSQQSYSLADASFHEESFC
jgi:hypothetical protein